MKSRTATSIQEERINFLAQADKLMDKLCSSEPSEESPEVEQEREDEPRFKKIKLNKKLCSIEYETYLLDDWYERKISGPSGKVTDHFRDAIAALAPLILRVCQTENCWLLERVNPIGISMAYVDGVAYGVTVTALYGIETSNSPLVVNAPMQKFGKDNPNEIGVLTVGEYHIVEKVLEHAQKYLDGDRRPEPKQLNLLDEVQDA
jgi:hypothetical protein